MRVVVHEGEDEYHVVRGVGRAHELARKLSGSGDSYLVCRIEAWCRDGILKKVKNDDT